MSTGRAIEAVTLALRALLQPVAPHVTARTLDQARAGGPVGHQLNIFLYDVTPNGAWRNQEPPGPAAGGGLHPPLALDLRYLLTAYGDAADDAPAHRILGEAMSILHDNAVLARDSLKAMLAEAGVHLQPDRVRLTQVHLGSEELSRLWAAFQTNYRLSVAYQASLVLIDTGHRPAVALPVLRRGRAAVDPQGRDEGPVLVAGAGPVLDQVSVEAWRGNAALPARTGDRLVIEGQGLGATVVRARFDHPRLPGPLWAAAAPESTDRRVVVPLPDALPAGFATMAVALGTPGQDEVVTVSNSLPLPVAVRLEQLVRGAVGAGKVRITVRCDRLTDGQVVLLLGDGAQVPPVAPVLAGASLTFDLPTARPSGTPLTVRLRVDGVDSIPLPDPDPDPAKPLPRAFDQKQQVVLP
jgi:hypothetical protein